MNSELIPVVEFPDEPVIFLDLGGNIRKGPVGRGNKCYCVPFDKNGEATEVCRNAPKLAGASDEKINLSELTTKFEKTARSRHHQLLKSSRPKSKERNIDPLNPLLRIVGDKNKQLHLKQWLHKAYPTVGLSSDLQPSRLSNEMAREVSVDVHEAADNRQAYAHVSRNCSKRMPEYDENGNNEQQVMQEDEDDEQYTDISNESEGESGNGSIASDNENGLYDEGFLRNFQHQQHIRNTQQNDSVTTASINSSQNIETEMEKIAKSLLLNEGSLMVVNRNPDVIRDLIHHSAKRSTKKIKSAINKPTTTASNLASGELYANSFFTNDLKQKKSLDEPDANEINEQFHRGNVNSSNVSTISSNHRDTSQASRNIWNQSSRSRNPLPINIEEIEKYSGSILTQSNPNTEQVTTSLNENNFILLDQLMKARKKFNATYQQQLEMMSQHEASSSISNNQKTNDDSTIPSSSTLV